MVLQHLMISKLAALGHIVPGFVIYQFAPIIHSWDMQLRTLETYVLVRP